MWDLDKPPIAPKSNVEWLDYASRLNFWLTKLYNFLVGLYASSSILTKYVVQTTDATVTDLAAFPIAEGETWSVEVLVIARRSTGADNAIFRLQSIFYRNTGGNVTQVGITASIITQRSAGAAAWNCTLNADTVAQTVDVRVTGAVMTINWTCLLTANKV